MTDWLYDATYAQAKLETVRMQLDAANKQLSTQLKVYYNTDFEGLWPIGVSAVVVAESETQAIDLLTEELQKRGLAYRGTMHELDRTKPHALILQDGDY